MLVQAGLCWTWSETQIVGFHTHRLIYYLFIYYFSLSVSLLYSALSALGRVTTDLLTNATAKTNWIANQLQLVKDHYLDGVNFDYEDAILRTQPDLRNGYRDLVARTTAAFKSYDPSLMVHVILINFEICRHFNLNIIVHHSGSRPFYLKKHMVYDILIEVSLFLL